MTSSCLLHPHLLSNGCFTYTNIYINLLMFRHHSAKHSMTGYQIYTFATDEKVWLLTWSSSSPLLYPMLSNVTHKSLGSPSASLASIKFRSKNPFSTISWFSFISKFSGETTANRWVTSDVRSFSGAPPSYCINHLFQPKDRFPLVFQQNRKVRILFSPHENTKKIHTTKIGLFQ